MNRSLKMVQRKSVGAENGAKIAIGLHAQTLARDDGFIAGSEITTLYLKKAFEKRTDVKLAFRVGPHNYRELKQDALNLFIIEGWHERIKDTIQFVRDNYPDAKILFWVLSFWGLEETLHLDIDGYMTNSQKLVQMLSKIKPTQHVMLAADPDDFNPLTVSSRYAYNVTYLGMYHPSKSQSIMDKILGEAIGFGLVIYGCHWDHHPFYRQCWEGVLPRGDISYLYASSKVVLAMTETRQRIAGMINNRIFEALSCGACVISEYYPELEECFGDVITCVRQSGDTKNALIRLIEDDDYRYHMGQKGRNLIEKRHTYDHRVEKIIDFYRSLT